MWHGPNRLSDYKEDEHTKGIKNNKKVDRYLLINAKLLRLFLGKLLLNYFVFQKIRH